MTHEEMVAELIIRYPHREAELKRLLHSKAELTGMLEE